MKIKWLGHAGFEIDCDNYLFLFDPWLRCADIEVSDFCSKSKVDVILVTHDHYDHVGDTLEIAKYTNAKVVATPELLNKLCSKGLDKQSCLKMNVGGKIVTDNYSIRMLQSYHTSECGIATGYILTIENKNIYHMGDTGLSYEFKFCKELYDYRNIDVLLIPIGDIFTMGPKEAAIATGLLNPKIVIPMHYGTFPILVKNAKEFAKWTNLYSNDTKVVILEKGSSITVA